MSGPTTIFSSDSLRIVHTSRAAPENRKLAFVFSALGNRVLDADAAGGAFLLDNGFDVVAFNSIEPDWFQSVAEAVFDAIDRAIPAARYDERVALGSSMGGYAAICFSRRLGCRRVLAYSPQFDASPEFDGRFAPATAGLAWRHLIEPDSIAPDCDYCFVYDGYDYDAVHVARLRALVAPERVREIVLRNAGHATVFYLYEIDRLKYVTLAGLTGGELSVRELRRGRRASRQYLKTLADRLSTRRPALAARVAALGGPFYTPPFALRWALDRSVPLVTAVAARIEACRLERKGFDAAFYRSVNWDVEVRGADPLQHYIRDGRREGRLVRFRNML